MLTGADRVVVLAATFFLQLVEKVSRSRWSNRIRHGQKADKATEQGLDNGEKQDLGKPGKKGDGAGKHNQGSVDGGHGSCQNGWAHIHQGMFRPFFFGHGSRKTGISMAKVNDKVDRNTNQNGKANGFH